MCINKTDCWYYFLGNSSVNINQTLICQPLTAENQIHFRDSPCGICIGKCAVGQAILRLP